MTLCDRTRIPLLLSLLVWLVCSGACAQTMPASAPASAPATEAALAARGQRLFLRCASCHDISGTGVAKTGPSLHGVVGRQAASVAGYAYSKSLAEQHFVWDDARLNAWLERPTAIAPGTTMAFEGLPVAADREAVIAYLKTQK